jgi:ubiquinone/menaquinone biosynthesis C-methylase UbiE
MNTDSEQIDDIHRQVPPNYYDRGIEKNVFQRYWHQKRFKHLPDMINGIGNRILDLGCHGGLLTSKITKHLKASTVGLDISEAAIQYAQKKYSNIEFKVADIQKEIPFPDASFDAVTAFDVIEHIPNLEFVVKEINRVLKLNGFFVLAVPKENLLFKTVWFFWTKGRGKVWNDVHVHEFDDSTLHKFFDSQGFKRVKEKKTHLGMYFFAPEADRTRNGVRIAWATTVSF